MLSPEILEMLSKLGAFGIMAVMWYRAETRADRERDKNEVLAKESIATSIKTEATLATLAQILTGRRAEQ